jgi:hypothetical protein
MLTDEVKKIKNAAEQIQRKKKRPMLMVSGRFFDDKVRLSELVVIVAVSVTMPVVVVVAAMIMMIPFMVVALMMIPAFMTPVVMMLEFFVTLFSSLPIGVMIADPIAAVLSVPVAVVPLMTIVPIAVTAPFRMAVYPLRMILADPVRIVVAPPISVAPLMTIVVRTHSAHLLMRLGMLLKPSREIRMVAQVGRIVHQARIRL